MIVLNVSKEKYGWSVRAGETMKATFWTRGRALREASCLADDIHHEGECVKLIVEGDTPRDSELIILASSSPKS